MFSSEQATRGADVELACLPRERTYLQFDLASPRLLAKDYTLSRAIVPEAMVLAAIAGRVRELE